MIPAAIIGFIWAIFIIVWLISALTAKRTASRKSGALLARILIALCVVVGITFSGPRSVFAWMTPISSPALEWVGVALVAAGVAFAIWARFYLGRNWGMPMTLKKDAELVTTGPYAYVRHPIYTGMLVAMLGSALGAGLWWFILFILMGVYFIFAAKTEEKIMIGEFGEKYADYMKRSKMLIPFLF